MDATQNRLSATYKYLAVFKESWRASHDEAMRLRDFEAELAQAVKVFELVDELIQQQRESVFRGLSDPSAEFEKMEQEAYSLWLGLIEEDMPNLEALESAHQHVEGADRLRACREKATHFLKHWRPARPALAVGSRVIDIDEEDADRIRSMLNSAAGSPGQPTRTPRAVPSGDPTKIR